jgi:hypothetical protein
LHAGDMASMTDFAMSTIKPMTPAWLYAGWKYLADRLDMIKRGWDACGLRSMFDERRAGVVRQAKLATHDTSHHLYPLFPSNDVAALPLEVAAGEHEPEMEPLYEKTEGAPTQEQLEEGDPSFVSCSKVCVLRCKQWQCSQRHVGSQHAALQPKQAQVQVRHCFRFLQQRGELHSPVAQAATRCTAAAMVCLDVA